MASGEDSSTLSVLRPPARPRRRAACPRRRFPPVYRASRGVAGCSCAGCSICGSREWSACPRPAPSSWPPTTTTIWTVSCWASRCRGPSRSSSCRACSGRPRSTRPSTGASARSRSRSSGRIPGAIKRVLQVLEAGRVVGIFPEGPFSQEGRLVRGQPGAAMVALRAGVPVVPAAIEGTYEALPRAALLPAAAPAARGPVRGADPLRPGAPRAHRADASGRRSPVASCRRSPRSCACRPPPPRPPAARAPRDRRGHAPGQGLVRALRRRGRSDRRSLHRVPVLRPAALALRPGAAARRGRAPSRGPS